MPTLVLERDEMTALIDTALDHMTNTSRVLRNRFGGVQAIHCAGNLEESIRGLERVRETLTIAERATIADRAQRGA